MQGVDNSPAPADGAGDVAFFEHGIDATKLPVKVDFSEFLSGAEKTVTESLVRLYLANLWGMESNATSSIRAAYYALRPVIAFLKLPPWEWTQNHISQFLANRRAEKDIGHSRQYQFFVYLRGFQTWVMGDLPICAEILRRFGSQFQEFITTENSIPIKRKGKTRKHPILPLSPQEIAKIGDEFDNQITIAAQTGSKSLLPLCRDKVIFWLLYNFGFRIAEVLSLTMSSFQEDRNYPEFGRYAIFAVIGKGSKDRYPHALDPSIRALMDWYIETVRVQFLLREGFNPANRNLLFFSERGCKLDDDQFRRSLKRMAILAGINRRMHPHLLRHTNTVELMPLLGPAGTQAHLGHENLSTTFGYYHENPDKIGAHIQDAIEGISEGINLRNSDKGST